jgi:hypothetical protein
MKADIERYRNDAKFNQLVSSVAYAIWKEQLTADDIRSAVATAESVIHDRELMSLASYAPSVLAEITGE